MRIAVIGSGIAMLAGEVAASHAVPRLDVADFIDFAVAGV